MNCNYYRVSFKFIENGHECKTSWSGSASSEADALEHAEAWFGFQEDGIEVTERKVDKL